MNDTIDNKTGELVQTEPSTIELLNKSEIDTQISTAKKYPRSIAKFQNNALAMVTLNESVARESIYILPKRKGSNKEIEGPSVRFAEMIQSCWGNCRSGARIIQEGAEFVTAQGVFHDLETNSAVTFEVQRRIVGSTGQRYGVDMIGVTANAACSVALRNAILKGVPKALWAGLYSAAKQTIAGDSKTFAKRCEAAMEAFNNIGIKKDMLFGFLEVSGKSDLTVDHLIKMGGMLTAIEDGEMSIRDMIAETTAPAPAAAPAPPKTKAKAKAKAKAAPVEQSQEQENPAPPAEEAKAPAPTTAPAPADDPGDIPEGLDRKKLEEKEAAQAEDQQSGVPGPESENFDIELYLEGLEDEFTACTEVEFLDEALDQSRDEVFEHIPEPVQEIIMSKYRKHHHRIRTSQAEE